MSDKVARAIGAGEMIEVDGKEYMIRPVSMKHLKEVQTEALRYYKRQFLKTFTDNADLLGDKATDILTAKMEEASRWDINDLPAKYINDVSVIKMNEHLVSWLKEKYGNISDSKNIQLAMVASALDAGEMSKDDILQLTGRVPPRVKVPYDAWWITATYEGMATMVWAGIGGPDSGVSREEVQGWSVSKLHEAVTLTEKLTTPAVGNM